MYTFSDPFRGGVQEPREEVPAAGADRGRGLVPLPHGRLPGLVLRQRGRQRLQVRAVPKGELPHLPGKKYQRRVTPSTFDKKHVILSIQSYFSILTEISVVLLLICLLIIE